jgi:Sec-independent protein secretion pathway component TatC
MSRRQEGSTGNKQSLDAPGKRQYTLRSLLLAITTVVVLFSVWLVFGRPTPVPGAIELAMLAGGIPCLFLGAMLGWPRCLGVIVCLLAGAIVSPPDPASMLIVAVPLTCVYCVAIAAWSRAQKRRGAEVDLASQEETE